jgi:hypothetical protein
MVLIKTQGVPAPVPVTRDCALEIDASDLRQWQQIAQPRADDPLRPRAPPERAPPPSEEPHGRPRPDVARLSPRAGPQAAEMILRLDIDFESIPDVTAFAEEVRADVARAARLDRSRVAVVGLRAGSAVVELSVEGDGGRSALAIVRGLKRQAADPASPLRAGRHTRRTLDVIIPADMHARASGGGGPGGGGPGGGGPGKPGRRDMQGFIDSRGVFRLAAASPSSLDQAPIFTTKELALAAGFGAQRNGAQGSDGYAECQALLGPVGPAGAAGGLRRAPLAMVQVAVNPQGMHPSILSALKHSIGSPPGAARAVAGPFGGDYAAFGGGLFRGSAASESYGGSTRTAGGSPAGGGYGGVSGFGGSGGTAIGEHGDPFRLHPSPVTLPGYSQEQPILWGQMPQHWQLGGVQQQQQPLEQMPTAPQLGGVPLGGVPPTFRGEVQARAGPGQFQGVPDYQGYAMHAFPGLHPQGMSPPTQPMMMQAPGALPMPYHVPLQQHMQTFQMQPPPMMHFPVQPRVVQPPQPPMVQVQMQPPMVQMQMQPPMVQMQKQPPMVHMQMQPRAMPMNHPMVPMHVQPHMMQRMPPMQVQMQPRMMQAQPPPPQMQAQRIVQHPVAPRHAPMVQMMPHQQPVSQGVWGY